ncbi:MAG: phospho-N-acetylmuramoyl-pentapeptide-transferase, partial [Paludibacteraceae bacterium]|nr:phospho-N-acetylmuramoyl-pentapeptide-transferase [Paludibacteraceae bacterium]
MIYSLFNHFNDVLGARLFTYISFRAILAFVIALLFSVLVGNSFINLLRRRNIAETQRDEKLDPFNVAKKGVPTMGGIVIIASLLVAVLLLGNLSNIYMILMLATTLILGTLGFADDYIKTFRHNKDGLNGWIKIAGQVLLGLIIGLTLRYSPVTTMNEVVETRIENNVEVVYKTPDVKSTRTTIPFFKNHNANYADMFRFLGEENMYRAGWIFFVLLTIFVVAAVSNGANLNDGMDGMCAGNSAIIGTALLILAYVSGSTVWADYFDVMYIPGSEELVVFLAAFVGALLGFLWWNGFPAQVFMGDTGSLTIGGIIAVSAI